MRRDWVEEVRDYFDLIKPGMKNILMSAELERDSAVIDSAWAISKDLHLGAESASMWRALKQLTEEGTEARQVVVSVPGEDGYAAWVKLHRRFGMALAMRQGTMLAIFSQLGMSKMKTPSETRSKVIEIDKMAKLTQEITGEAIGNSHYKSILVGMLDPSHANTPPT